MDALGVFDAGAPRSGPGDAIVVALDESGLGLRLRLLWSGRDAFRRPLSLVVGGGGDEEGSTGCRNRRKSVGKASYVFIGVEYAEGFWPIVFARRRIFER